MEQDEMDFLSNLEHLQFTLSRSTNQKPLLQADACRNMYLHLSDRGPGEEYKNSNFVTYLMAADKTKETYSNIVDNMDESGLNNFAAEALSLCHYHKNESSKWQSSLTADSVNSLQCFQDMKKEKESKRIDDLNLILPIKRKRVIDTSPGLSNPSTHGFSPILPHDYTSPTLRYPAPSHSVQTLPSRQIESCKTRVQQNTSPYSSNLKENRSVGGKQLETTPSDSSRRYNMSSAGVSAHSGSDAFHKSERYGSVSISASFAKGPLGPFLSNKVGGPYANFGQKPKKWQNKQNFDYGKMSTKSDEDYGDEDESDRQTPFRTAKEQFLINQQKVHGDRHQVTGSNYGAVKKSLGTSRRGPANRFVPPVLGQDEEGEDIVARSSNSRKQNPSMPNSEIEEPVDERLKGIDPNMIELIKNDIMDQGSPITWTDIAGLEFAKKTIQEIVVWPMLRPDIFTGLRGPPKGLLLFGPPGTGKTLIGKCIASQSKSTFFCISASSLTSKWVGEGEKMVRALFAVARCSQPAVVFIDEVDSLLSQRSDSEHESSRRIKTEFLVQLDGASTISDERLLVIGATNRPQEIDEAARRRFVKRLLIPLPERAARKQIIVNLVAQQKCDLSESDLSYICDKTDGYSGADMSNLCREAALGPIRSIPFDQMETITSDQVRPMLLEDFKQALLQVRASVSSKDLELYVDWNKTYGSFGF